MDSPNLSINSADEALYEMLGVDKLNLDVEAPTHSFEKHTGPLPTRNTVTSLRSIPPTLCHRPQTPHRPLLLQTTSPLLTVQQCNHIISLGGRTSNDGGTHYGPSYVTSAQNGPSGASVDLQKPNHHKVCVFKDVNVLTWLKKAFDDHLDPFIKEWCLDNNIVMLSGYAINPRLRLLRYDAQDHDIFLPHYDATTTYYDECCETTWESKLTILVYLNTGGGSQFSGGRTLFLNSLEQSDSLPITPQRGHFVVFNHELYHASEGLELNEHLIVNEVVGGSKFVMRSDVMFAKEQDLPALTVEGIQLETTRPDMTVESVLCSLKNCNNLADILEEMDMKTISVKTLMVPGRETVVAMLVDLGVDLDICERFVSECEQNEQ